LESVGALAVVDEQCAELPIEQSDIQKELRARLRCRDRHTAGRTDLPGVFRTS
jgi:chorismate synthase